MLGRKQHHEREVPRLCVTRMQILFEDYLKHGFTAAWLLVEFAISRLPVTSTWVIFSVVYAIVYATFLWIWWAAEEKWVYSVLDWRCPVNLAYYVAVAGLVMLTFWIMCDPPNPCASVSNLSLLSLMLNFRLLSNAIGDAVHAVVAPLLTQQESLTALLSKASVYADLE